MMGSIFSKIAYRADSHNSFIQSPHALAQKISSASQPISSIYVSFFASLPEQRRVNSHEQEGLCAAHFQKVLQVRYYHLSPPI